MLKLDLNNSIIFRKVKKDYMYGLMYYYERVLL